MRWIWSRRHLRIAKLVDLLAALEHEQWIHWSKTVAKTENISLDTYERWVSFWKPYSLLYEPVKEHDKKWAREVMKLLMRCGIMPICSAESIDDIEAEAKYTV